MKNFSYKQWVIGTFYFLSYIAIAFFCFRKLLPLDGVLGYRHDWTINFFDLKNFWQNAVSIWQTRVLGEITTYGGSAYLANIAVGMFSFLGLSGAAFSKIFPVVLMAGSGISMYYFAQTVNLKRFVAFLTGLFYLLTPVVFNNMVAGYSWYLLAYALSPLVLLFYFKAVDSIDKKSFYRNTILCALILAIAISQIQFALMLLLAMMLYLPFLSKKILRGVAAIFLIGIITVLIHLPWILPTLLTSIPSIGQSASQASVAAWNKTMSSDFANTFYLTAFYAKRYFLALVEGSHSWQIASIFIPILAFLALILARGKKIIYFILLAIVGIFLAKGVNPPLENLSNFIYSQPFLAAAFRQSYHWIFPVALSYAILIGFTLNAISDFLVKHKLVKLNYFVYGSFLIMLFFYTKPILPGDFSGQMQSYKPAPTYSEIYNQLKTDQADYRVLWLPAIGPVKQNDFKYSINFDPIIENMPKKSFSSEGGILFFDGNSTKIRNYLIYLLYNNPKLTNLGQILSLANIKKVFFREDYQSDYPNISDLAAFPDLKEKWQNNTLTTVLANNLKLIDTNLPITTFENLQNKNHLYAAANPSFTTKNLSVLADAQITNDAFFFSSQNNFNSLKNNLHVDTSADKNEMITSLIDQKYVYNPANYAKQYFDARDGWIKGNNWFWYDTNFASEIEDFIFSKKQDTLQIPLNINSSGQYKVLVKSYAATTNTQVEIKINNQIINFKPSTSGFNWQTIGDINLSRGRYKIDLTSLTGEPAISKLIIIPDQQFLDNANIANELISNSLNKTLNYDASAQIEFQTINTTHYKIKISNHKPFFLVFSENYNPNWTLQSGNTKFAHFLVNGYANAFLVDKTGEYEVDLTLSSQKLSNLGLIMALMVILGCLVIYKSGKL